MKNARFILLTMILLAGISTAADQALRKIVYQEEPQYPAAAAKNSIHGTVKLKIWISPEGSVRRLECVGGHPLLAESALRSVRNWKFEPAQKESTEMVEVKF